MEIITLLSKPFSLRNEEKNWVDYLSDCGLSKTARNLKLSDCE